MNLLTETRLLKPVAQATVPARTKPFDAVEFYRTRAGLYVYNVYNTFTDRLDLRTRPMVDSAPERSYVASFLKVKAYNEDIRKELPETHLSTLEDIAGLIEAQPDGQSGFLLNNGYANLFYVLSKNGEVFAVDVRWVSNVRTWDVRDWKFVEVGCWHAGNQILCPGILKL